MDTSFLIAILGAALGAASMLLHVIAPRTKTPVDDKLRDDIDEVLVFIRGRAATPGPAVNAPKGAALLAVLVVLGLGGGSQLGCAGAKAEVSAIAAGVVTCAKGDVPAAKTLGLQLGTEALGQLLTAGAVDWSALGAEAEGAAKSQGLTVASCALGDLVAELDRALHPAAPAGPSARVAVVEPLAGAHAALAAFEQAHGITRIDP